MRGDALNVNLMKTSMNIMHGMYNIKIKESCFIQNVFSGFQIALPYSFHPPTFLLQFDIFKGSLQLMLYHNTWPELKFTSLHFEH